MIKGEIWTDYYAEYDYFGRDNIRPYCEPRVMIQDSSEAPAIVLVHGLTDSPYFMNAIGTRFFDAGFSVYIPLLHMHGLKSPAGMRNVSLSEWKRNTAFAIAEASKLGRTVSIGGLSTGGSLSVYSAYTDKRINGGVFLFSAALDLPGAFGEAFESLLRGPMGAILDSFDGLFGKELIGENPYRYSRMDKGGAAQLSHLIKEVDALTGERGAKRALAQPVFVAHSEADTAASISGVEDLLSDGPPEQFFYRIPESEGVKHASVVLEEDIKPDPDMKDPLEQKYDNFDLMMKQAVLFAEKHIL